MRSSLGRLIRLRGGASFLSSTGFFTYNPLIMSRTSSSSSYYAFPPRTRFNSFQVSHFGEYTNKSEVAKEEGSDSVISHSYYTNGKEEVDKQCIAKGDKQGSDPMKPTSNSEVDKQCLEEAPQQGSDFTDQRKGADKPFIQKGDIVNVNDLLFTKERDYLIKNNNKRVKAEQLEGKVICIYFMLLPDRDHAHALLKRDTSFITDVYYDLHPDNNFEVVFVAENENTDDDCPGFFLSSLRTLSESNKQRRFDYIFSDMPWTAIPFSDVASRERLETSFGVSRQRSRLEHMFVIVDPTGIVLQCDAWQLLFDYGALGYPFSDKRIKYLREEDDATIKQPSLEKLLASPERDYVISNKGDEVLIRTFEHKVVALYFCSNSCAKSQLFKELKLAYEQLAQVGKPFEVVLVYGREFGGVNDWPSEESFREVFDTMPWLALPYRDPSCKKLNRIFEISYNEAFARGGLVIFGPHAEFIEPFGADILWRYKIPGYPFTRKIAAKLETEKVKELKLETIMDSDTVLSRKDGSQVPFCQLAGKRIMLIVENNRSNGVLQHNSSYCPKSLNAHFLTMLKKRYRETKGTDDEFEVIRILLCKYEESSISKHLVGDMPWLVSSANNWILANLGSYIWSNIYLDFLDYFPVFAFDQDGRLVRKTRYPTFEDMNFPFSGCSLEEKGALSELNTHFMWNYWDYFHNKGRIYSYSDNQTKVNLLNF